jgi:hypothetical protein
MADTTLRTGRAAPIPPPRQTGEVGTDSTSAFEWMSQIYRSLVESGLADPGYQFALVAIDPDDLPDPTLTTIGRAQATANLALQSRRWGHFTVSEAETSATITFATPLADADYHVVATPVGFTGAPDAASRTITVITKTVNGFTATLSAAPGASASVTFDYLAGA